MAVRTYDGDRLRVVAASGYLVEPLAGPSGRRTARGARTGIGLPTGPITIDNAADQPDAVVAALAGQGFTLVDTPVSLRRDPAVTRRSATPTRIHSEVDADEDAVLLTEQDGYYTWVEPSARSDAVRHHVSNRSPLERPRATREITFEVYPDGAPGSRRGLAKLALGPLRTFVLKYVARAVTGKAINYLESHVATQLLQLNGSDPTTWTPLRALDGVPKDRPARVLLFVHGTFSSTAGGFGALAAHPAGKDMLERAIAAYDLVIGFDHRTLSVDPAANAADLIGALRALDWPHPPLFDMICHSRGALVTRCLIEEALPQSDWGAGVDRVVFVGGTNAGTELAAFGNWKRLVDIYTNLAAAAARLVPEQLAATILAEGIKTVGALVKALISYAVDEDGVPGLAAMTPAGPVVTELNKPQPGQPLAGTTAWYVIAGNFEPKLLGDGAPPLPARFLLTLADGVIDSLMRHLANDLVVDTASMSAIDVPVGTPSGFVREIFAFDKAAHVYHTVYFQQSETAAKLVEWLALPPKQATRAARRQPQRRTAAKRGSVRGVPNRIPSGAQVLAADGLGRPTTTGVAVLGHRDVGGRFPTSGAVLIPDRFPDVAMLAPDPGGEGRSRTAPNAPRPRKASRPASTPAPPVTAHFRASMAAEATIDQLCVLTVNIGREAFAATTGSTAQGQATVDTARKITVQAVVKANAEVAGLDRADIDVPAPGSPCELYFDIRPLAPGEGEVHVVARQGPVALLTLVLKPTFVAAGTGATHVVAASAEGVATQAPKTCVKQWLRISERIVGTETYYDYELESSDPQILSTRYSSPRLRGNPEDYVNGIYERIEQRFVGNAGDAAAFARELRALGGELFDELIPRELGDLLWKHKKDLQNVLVLSDEPFIPWELVHLKETARLPDQSWFLAQLGSMRWLQGTYPPSVLTHRKARVVAPVYPIDELRLDATAGEAAFVRSELGARTLAADSASVLAAISKPGAFDVLHFSGHGAADGRSPRILLTGRVEGNTYVPDSLDGTTVGQHVALVPEKGPVKNSRPLIVLNACQAGRSAPQVTHIGGFAHAFLGGGAGAFISSMWSVGDAPAKAFTEALYGSLRKGKTLARASVDAREAARAAGDEATWLAYVVYGDPCAKLVD